MVFRGFTGETVPWFDGLILDNSRAYFTAHRDVYDRAVRQPLLDLLTDLSSEFGGTVKLFRPNRDVRFSANKNPYKTNAYGVLMGCPNTAAAYYVSVSPDGLHTATGYYEMAKDQVARYRSALTTGEKASAIGAELRSTLDALGEAGWEVDGAAMKVRPRGVSADAPNLDLVRYRSLTVSGFLEPERMCDASAVAWITGVWRAAQPMNDWLDRYVGESTLPPEEAWR
jgi:uncharacterized protein (TIGR02453 family)